MDIDGQQFELAAPHAQSPEARAWLPWLKAARVSGRTAGTAGGGPRDSVMMGAPAAPVAAPVAKMAIPVAAIALTAIAHTAFLAPAKGV